MNKFINSLWIIRFIGLRDTLDSMTAPECAHEKKNGFDGEILRPLSPNIKDDHELSGRTAEAYHFAVVPDVSCLGKVVSSPWRLLLVN